MNLHIKLSLDSEAMTNPFNVAAVLRNVADTVESGITWTEHDDGFFSAVAQLPNNVFDLNGNSVGYWEVTK